MARSSQKSSARRVAVDGSISKSLPPVAQTGEPVHVELVVHVEMIEWVVATAIGCGSQVLGKIKLARRKMTNNRFVTLAILSLQK